MPFGQRIKYRFFKIFISFDIPLRSLNYVRVNEAEVGTIDENPFTNWVKCTVVNSGNEEAFGEDPREITGITIMTDSDNTGESTLAWFGKIILSRE